MADKKFKITVELRKFFDEINVSNRKEALKLAAEKFPNAKQQTMSYVFHFWNKGRQGLPGAQKKTKISKSQTGVKAVKEKKKPDVEDTGSLIPGMREADVESVKSHIEKFKKQIKNAENFKERLGITNNLKYAEACLRKLLNEQEFNDYMECLDDETETA